MSKLEPWQLTEAEWNRQREECRPNIAQSNLTKASASEAIRRHEKLLWLLYGINDPEYPVTWHHVVGKAIEEGKLVRCPGACDECQKMTETPLPEGWAWDDGEEKYYAWCPECIKWWGWK